MRFKNRYYLIEFIWENIGSSTAANASASSAAIAAAPSPAQPATTDSSTSSPSSSPPKPFHLTSSAAGSVPYYPPRYLDPSFQSWSLQHALKEAMLSHFGEYGYGRVSNSLQVRYLNALTSTAILRIARDDSRCMAAILAFLTKIRDKSLLIRTIHVGGTIRSCQKECIKLQRARLQQLRKAVEMTVEDKVNTTGFDSVEQQQSKQLASVLASATASNPRQKTPQQALIQLANLLTQYKQHYQQQQQQVQNVSIAAPSSSPTSSSSSSSSTTVAPTLASVTAALNEAEKAAEKEIMALET